LSLRHAVLIALQNEEATGYEIAKWFDQGMGYFWSSTHQQIYQELRKMVVSELLTFREVSQSGKPAKKIYTITESGINELKSWLEKPVKQYVVKDALLMKIYSGHLLAPEKLLQEILTQQNHARELHTKYDEIEKKWFSEKENLSLQQQYIFLTLRNGIIQADAWLKWSHEVVEFLEGKIEQTSNPPKH